MSVLSRLKNSSVARRRLKRLAEGPREVQDSQTVVISNRAWVPIAGLGTPSNIERVKSRLTIFPRSTSPHNPDPEPIILYEQVDGVLGVPRDYFARNTKGNFKVKRKLSKGLPLGFTSKVKLWDNQLEPVLQITEKLQSGDLGAVLEAPCGTGKTIMALEIARRLGVTTLIIVHKEFLLKQWKDRIIEFLPDAKVGIAWKGDLRFRGKDFVVAMLGSLLSRRYVDIFYQWPGLVITDEVHRIGAPTWGQVIHQFASQWRLGLSATTHRKDNADRVFLWNIGPVAYRLKGQRRQPKVKRIQTGAGFPARVDPDKLGDAILYRILSKSTKRNGLIIATLVKAAETGRKIIVFSDLREHLLTLKEGLQQLAPKIHSEVFVGSWYHPNWLRSNRKSKPKFQKQKQRDWDRATGAQIIFATFQMAKEGLDIEALNTCFLALPKTDVEQAVGRILRTTGVKDPIIVDFLDDCCTRLKRMAGSRMKLYKKLGAFKVTEQACLTS